MVQVFQLQKKEFPMKTSLTALLVLFSTNVWAGSQLTCQVNEDINAPSQARSVKYQLTSPLSGPHLQTRIDLVSNNLNLSFGVETFLSELTSPGQQVVIIGITDNSKNGNVVSVDGHGSAETFYDTDAGSLFINCSVQ
jgi:hypothetical protein